MKRLNTLFFTALLGIVVVFIGWIVVHERTNAHEITLLKKQAMKKAVLSQRENRRLQKRLGQVESSLDSLLTIYVQDSVAWYQERATLKGNLRRERAEVNTFRQAYESTKKALETQSISLPVQPRDVYDLSPVLGDSTKSGDDY